MKRASVVMSFMALLVSAVQSLAVGGVATASDDSASVRVRERDAGQALVEEVRSRSDRFGGIIYDDGFVVMRLAGAPRLSFDPAANNVRVRYEPAIYSFDELQRIADEVITIATTTDPRASGFVSVGVEERSNKVVLEVASLDAPFLDEPLPSSDALVVRVGELKVPLACNTRSDCLPLRGAVRLLRPIPEGYLSCSLGALARRPNGWIALVTSGHCDFDVNKLWYHYHSQGGNQAAGGSLKNGLLGTDYIDILSIYNTGLTANPYNRLFYSSAIKSRVIGKTISNNQLVVGFPISKTGVASGTSDGEVTRLRHFQAYVDPYTNQGYFSYVWTADFYATGGDSGGPVWWTLTPTNDNSVVNLAGFVAGGDPNAYFVTDFVSQADALYTLGLTKWCLTDAC